VPLVPIGEKVFEEIDYTPAQLSVLEHHQVKYGPAPEVAEERQIATVVAAMPRPASVRSTPSGPGVSTSTLPRRPLE
jgi:hypothetical protein